MPCKDEKVCRIFTFWEPEEKIPGYLKLCMKTWTKFFPDYEIVVLNYANLTDWIGKDCFDPILYQKFSLPKQADAIRCAVLKKYGGLWLDCDTIITGNNIHHVLQNESSFMLIDQHIAFIKAQKESVILTKWFNQIKMRLKFYKAYHQKPYLFHRFLLFLCYPRKYKKLVKNLENWDFLGNGALGKILKKAKRPTEFFSIDKVKGCVFPELIKYGCISKENYQKFYFDNDFSAELVNNPTGVILLHNSWTPEKYLQMDEQEFLKQNNTLSNFLKKWMD